MGEEEIEAISAVIRSQNLFRYDIPQGNPNHLRETEKFEREFADRTQTKYCLGVSSGTSALLCALSALKIGPGDEVILPSYTFVATPISVLSMGAVPVIAEINETLTIDPDDIEKRITERTRAIIVVHMAGLVCEMDRILEIAKRRNLPIIEDTCQACGGTYKGRPLGSIGALGCFSFNHFKTMACGEGGAITTNHQNLFERSLILHDPGVPYNPRFQGLKEAPFVGFNFRLNEILSAVLRVQLKRLDGWLEQLRTLYKRYASELSEANAARPVRLNDPKGGIGEVFFLIFKTEELAQRFVLDCTKHSISALRLFEDRSHICFGWEVVLPQLKERTWPKTEQWARLTVALRLSPLLTETVQTERLKTLRSILSSY